MKRPILIMPAILFLLALLVFAPVVVMGVQNERNARAALSAGDELEAAQQFEMAAQRLFWKPTLWNDAGAAYWHIAVSPNAPEARFAYEKAAQRNVLDACGWSSLGQIYYFVDDEEIGLQTLLSGLEQYPDNFDLSNTLAYFYRRRENYDLEKKYLLSALDHADTAFQCASTPYTSLTLPAFMHYRAGLLLMPDEPSRALDELSTASLVDDRYAPVVETLRTTLNLASLEDDPAEKLVVVGRGLGLAEEWSLAASAFHDATQADPANASAWAWLAEAQYQLGEDPLVAFERAASINPNDPTLLSLRSFYYQRHNDLESALIDVAKLAALEPENPHWQVSLGALYAERGDLPTALAAYQRAVELAPDDPVYRQALALFSFKYRYDMAGIGLSAARRAVILAPNDARFIDTLGLVHFGLEHDEDAQRQFLRALEKDPDYAAAYLHLGMLYIQRGHWDQARTALVNAQTFATDQTVRDEAARLLTEYFQE